MSRDGKIAKSLFNVKVDQWKSAFITYKGNEIFTPDMLMEMRVDISKYIKLNNMDIKTIKSKMKLDSQSFEVGLKANKIVTVTERLIFGEPISAEYGDSIIIDKYFYSDEGKLNFVDAYTNYEEGELFNLIFLNWQGEKISEIFYITATETNDENVEVRLCVFQ